MIAILAAILFPVFAKAREKARQSSCLSNMKQLVLADLQYAQDYDERFGPNWTNVVAGVPGSACTDGTPRLHRLQLLAPYLKNTQVLLCPSVDTGVICCNLTPRNYHPIYAGSGVKLGTYEAPAETVLWGEGATYMEIPALTTANWIAYWSIKHNDGANVGYTDGHCKWAGRSNLSALRYIP